MKCPLSQMTTYFELRETRFRWGDCIKEECAWWDNDKGMCFRASEPIELRLIRAILRGIRDKKGG